MPVYEYKCQECESIFDMFFPLKEWDVKPTCPACGGESKKQLTAQIQRDEPTWLDDGVRGAIQDTDDPTTKPIENRCDYKRHLRDNGIIER